MTQNTGGLWVLDLDGVVWRGPHAVEGSVEAIARLQRAGATVVFATNNSAMTPTAFSQRLASHGIDAKGEVVTSSMAASTLIEPGETVFAIGEEGVRSAVRSASGVLWDAETAAKSTPDIVICGITNTFDYAMLKTAARSLHAGARLIATNLDPTFPTGSGMSPGNGSLVAAVSTAGGVEPTVAGKPCVPMARLVIDRYGDQGLMIGDRVDTDGLFAVELGYEFGLVFSGVLSEEDLPVEPAPAYTAPDLAAMVTQLGF